MQGYVRKRGDKWYYTYELGIVDGKRKRIEKVGGTTKKEAEKALRKAIQDYENSGLVFTPSEISVTDYFNYWLEQHVKMNCKYGTIRNYTGHIKNHILPKIGDYKLRNITPAVIQELVNDLYRGGMGKSVMHSNFMILITAFKMAVYPYQFIKENPVQYVKLPKYEAFKVETTQKVLSDENFNKLIEKYHPGTKQYIPIMIAYYTGFRVGEVLSLTWEDIDFEAKTITVNSTVIEKSKSVYCITPPKSRKSNRTILVSDNLLRILHRHKLAQTENKLHYGELYTRQYMKENGDITKEVTDRPLNLVCTWENGKMVSRYSMVGVMEYVQDNLDKDFSFHNLRHTHATKLIENGANMKDVQERLGHSNYATTANIYAHVTEDMSKNTVDIFDRACRHKI